ncbi:MAG: D-sedoheptulose 7-phosphate isomerase [Veillonellales bacterium]
MSVVEAVQNGCLADIEKFAQICQAALKNGRTIYFCGNGGSAADCQHLAAEFVGRFVKERHGLPAVALTTDTSILTAVGNDYGFDQVFARQVDALVRQGDVVVGISTSGNSANVVRAMDKARLQGAKTIGLTGQQGGKLAKCCDLCLQVPSQVTARIQEAHILIGHIVCELIDEEFA